MNHSEMMQQGVDSKFDTTLASLMRMHKELEEANWYSGFFDLNNIELWLGALAALDREISPYLSEDQEKALVKVRVLEIKKVLPNKIIINSYRKKLDVYERHLRKLHSGKGFGIKADVDSMNSVALRSFQ